MTLLMIARSNYAILTAADNIENSTVDNNVNSETSSMADSDMVDNITDARRDPISSNTVSHNTETNMGDIIESVKCLYVSGLESAPPIDSTETNNENTRPDSSEALYAAVPQPNNILVDNVADEISDEYIKRLLEEVPITPPQERCLQGQSQVNQQDYLQPSFNFTTRDRLPVWPGDEDSIYERDDETAADVQQLGARVRDAINEIYIVESHLEDLRCASRNNAKRMKTVTEQIAYIYNNQRTLFNEIGAIAAVVRTTDIRLESIEQALVKLTATFERIEKKLTGDTAIDTSIRPRVSYYE